MTTAIIIGLLIVGNLIYFLLFRRPSLKEPIVETRKDILIAKLTTNEFVEKYNSNNGQIKGGSLCFYGKWFGRPYDNYHELESVSFDELANTLTFIFNEKECLTIFNPDGICEYQNKLTIADSDKIEWKWFYYGKPQTEDNIYFIEVYRSNNTLTGKSNVNWYTEDFQDLSVEKPALLWT